MELSLDQATRAKITKDLLEDGYTIVPNVLSEEGVTICIAEFKAWQSKIKNHDKIHQEINPHGIYKYHGAGHTRCAWRIRTEPNVQDVFKHIWDTGEIVVSFDGSCYISKEDMNSYDKVWTHTDQGPKDPDQRCYQGIVALTDNKERTLRLYKGSHRLHQGYFRPREAVGTTNWHRIDASYLALIEDTKLSLHIPAGSMVVWDSRVFHQNQLGKPGSEERMVQYVCYLPKNHPQNNDKMRQKRLKYLKEQRTTSHWPYPIRVNGLQPHTYGKQELVIDYEELGFNDLSEYMPEIMKIV